MELSVKDIKGFKVYNHEANEPWGTVTDVCFDCHSAKVTELVVETLSIIPIAKTVKFDEINNIIKGAVVLKNDAMPQMRNKNLAEPNAAGYFGGIEYVAEREQEKKKLRDMRFDFETGELLDLVVSKNIFTKKSILKANKMSLKDNTIYVEAERRK